VLSQDGTVLNTLKVGISPYGIAVTAGGIWVTNSGSDSISRR
jgi:DNA-binding beta-propeller fold protein YncE